MISKLNGLEGLILILKNQKTAAYLWYEKDSVKPDKSCFRARSDTVLNNLYLLVIIWLNIVIATSLFKHDLLQLKGIFKNFNYIHIPCKVMNKKVFS